MTPIHQLLKTIFDLKKGTIQGIKYRQGRLDLKNASLTYHIPLSGKSPDMRAWEQFNVEAMVKSPKVQALYQLIQRLKSDCEISILVLDALPVEVRVNSPKL